MARGVRRRKSESTPSIRHSKAEGSIAPGVPEVYQSLLAETHPHSPTGEDRRNVKRRRIGGRLTTLGETKSATVLSFEASDSVDDLHIASSPMDTVAAPQQTIYNDFDDSDDSDMDWEDVKIGSETKRDEIGENETLTFIIGGHEETKSKQVTQRRKAMTGAERKVRLDVHKMHLLCLLVHVQLRNHWCNDPQVQKAMRSVLSKRTILSLDDDDTRLQFQRSRDFLDGLKQAIEDFIIRFEVTARGLSRSYWTEDADQIVGSYIHDDIDLPTQKIDFREIAYNLQASRDVGAQLFCAMLRSAGVETRLVCSLQPLPFTAGTRVTTPLESKPARVVSYQDSRARITEEESGVVNNRNGRSDTSTYSTLSTNGRPTVDRIKSRLSTTRIGRQPAGSGSCITTKDFPASKPTPVRRPIRESPYPVYWVEAFSAAIQKWIPVNPMDRKTLGAPSKFEPPASDLENRLSYVIAFEDNGSARDVTKRYTKAFNAKTRNIRVEVTKGGERWWRRVMGRYARTYDLDRDQVEVSQLTAKEAAEEMPKNIQDFKKHPYYVLERHLRRNEALHPRREVGKVTTSRSGINNGSKNLEPIFRRRDVHTTKSADGWYRFGREIKVGEQPLKRVQPRRRQNVHSNDEDDEAGENAGTPMYAAFQTVAYEAPPVVRGKIPKNGYGNLDVYVPSMVPPGGVHITHTNTARAAKILGVDYSDAVIGFDFKGRRGTAVIKGAVIATEYHEAVLEVIRSLDDERAEAEETRRSLEALNMWKRLLIGLRIRERIAGYAMDYEGEEIRDLEHANDGMENVDGGGGGGFLPDTESIGMVEPDAKNSRSMDDDRIGGFLTSSHNEDFSEPITGTIGYGHSLENCLGGGFVEEGGNPHQRGSQLILDETFAVENIKNPVTEDSSPNISPQLFTLNRTLREAPSEATNPLGLSTEELAEAHILQSVYESEIDRLSEAPRLRGKNPPIISPSEPLTRIPGTADAILALNLENVPTQPPPIREPKTITAMIDEESEVDRSSLLSHDPEDDDADPEWLA